MFVQDIRLQPRLRRLEKARIVEQCAVHASTVGTFDVYELHAAVGQWLLCAEVGEAVSVLHFADSDDAASQPLQTFCSHISQDARHVGELVLIFHLRPVVVTVRQVLVIVLVLARFRVEVMSDIKKVLEIVESNAIEPELAVLCKGYCCEEKQPREENSLAHRGNSVIICLISAAKIVLFCRKENIIEEKLSLKRKKYALLYFV